MSNHVPILHSQFTPPTAKDRFVPAVICKRSFTSFQAIPLQSSMRAPAMEKVQG